MLGSLLVVLGATLVAASVQSITGFGFGIVAVPILSLFLPLSTASVLLALSSFSLNLYLIARLRRHIDLSDVVPSLVAVAVGVPVGLVFLTSVDDDVLARVLGVFLLGYVAWSVVEPILRRRRGSQDTAQRSFHPIVAGVPLGLASGALSGAFAMGGPPLVAYVSSFRYKHLRHVVTIQLLLGVSGALRIVGISLGGLVTREILAFAAAGLAGSIAGATIVIATGIKLPKKTLRRMVMGLIGFVAVKYLVVG